MKSEILIGNQNYFIKAFFDVGIIFVMVLLAVLPTSDEVYANGRVTDWDTAESDRFQVSLGTIPANPRIGIVHISIRAKDLRSGEFINNGSVFVAAIGPIGSSAVSNTPFESGPADGTYFDGLINLDKEGLWEISVTIDIDQDSETLVFQVNVIKTHPLTGAVTLIAIIGFLTVIGFSVRKFFIEQVRSKRIKDSI